MNNTFMPNNRHPVDELFDVREAIKTYQKREEALKEQISILMGNKDSLGGDEYIAVQQASTRNGTIDTKALIKDGIDIEKYRKPKTVTISMRLERRVVGL